MGLFLSHFLLLAVEEQVRPSALIEGIAVDAGGEGSGEAIDERIRLMSRIYAPRKFRGG